MIVEARYDQLIHMDRSAADTPLLLSLLLGAFYTLFIGFGNLPVNLQTFLFWTVLMVSIVIMLRERRIALTRLHLLSLTLGTGIAGFAAVTTSNLIVSVSSLSLYFTVSYFLLGLYRNTGFPTQAVDYLIGFIKFSLTAFYEFLFNLILLKPLHLFKYFGLPKWKISRETAIGLIIACPVLMVFHVLFSLINTEYSRFMEQILTQLWQFIKLILDIDLIIFLLKTFLTSYTFYILLTNREKPFVSPAANLQPEVKRFIVILAATIGLFAIFSFFQTKLLFTKMTELVFKTLSDYTQAGFWELILVSIIGYGLSLWIIPKIKKTYPPTLRLKHLLTIFTAELLLITVFTFHKLYWLQLIFGLKDQRILATLAVILITGTFILFLLRLYERISPQQIFLVQAVAFLSVVFLLNLFNIDWLITKTYPISYFVDGKKYKDYSYLLGNSYDNTSEWLALINEYKQFPPPLPQDYYWGWYKPICDKTWDRWDNIKDKAIYKSTTYLEDHYAFLNQKYGQPAVDLTKLTEFNLHEYQAYQLVTSHRQIFDDFTAIIKAKCGDTLGR